MTRWLLTLFSGIQSYHLLNPVPPLWEKGWKKTRFPKLIFHPINGSSDLLNLFLSPRKEKDVTNDPTASVNTDCVTVNFPCGLETTYKTKGIWISFCNTFFFENAFVKNICELFILREPCFLFAISWLYQTTRIQMSLMSSFALPSNWETQGRRL